MTQVFRLIESACATAVVVVRAARHRRARANGGAARPMRAGASTLPITAATRTSC